jgi:hypothetical protein
MRMAEYGYRYARAMDDDAVAVVSAHSNSSKVRATWGNSEHLNTGLSAISRSGHSAKHMTFTNMSCSCSAQL